MNIFTHPEELSPSCMALGNFDGVHTAHRLVLLSCVQMARKMGVPSGVLLFRTMMKPMISSLSEKIEMIAECGLDFVYLVDFTPEFKNLSKEEFISFLTDTLKVRGVSVGYDYRFSRNACGSVSDLEYTKLLLSVTPPVCRNGIPISSTEIRSAILEDDLKKVFSVSGRRFFLSGTVQKGKQNGRKMGFQTANLIPEDTRLLPSDGVYSGWTEWKNKRYKSVINIGKNPTFGENGRTVESHLLDFEGDLYGEQIRVIFYQKQRGERKFSGMDALQKQIQKDKEQARKDLREMETKFTGVIMAAGMGTRMKSEKPKVLHEVGGKALLQNVIDICKAAGAEQVISIIGHKAEMVREVIGDASAYALQKEQKGTGHAVMQAVPQIEKAGDTIVILSGDAPLLRPETLSAAISAHKASENQATVLTAVLDCADGYGRILRDGAGNVRGIVEHKDATEEERKVREINSGMYVFERDALLEALKEITPNNAQGEYYLTDTLGILLGKGMKIGAYIVEDKDEIRGINDRVQLAEAEACLEERLRLMHMKNGVTMIAPETVWLASDVEIGQDTVIYPNVILKNGTKIGKNCVIGSNTQIEQSEIKDGAEILSSVILNSFVDENTHVGPFAYIRPNTHVGKSVKVGDFVELKNSTIGDGTKISHLTYVGDSDVGERVNFGCGTVTVNYDGKKKYRTKIGDDCFIGCNTNLVAPVTVENGGYTAAGSTITDTVPEESLAIARARQVVKTNWKDRRK